jgi:hypothetical protein
VVDRRLVAIVIGDDPDEGVADGAALVADRKHGHPFEHDPVAIDPEAGLPTRQPAVERRREGPATLGGRRVGRGKSE